MKFWHLMALFAITAQAQTPTKGALSLNDYLSQVKTQNPEARAVIDQVEKAEMRLDEAEVSLSSEFYGSYNYVDDKDEPTISFSGSRRKEAGWRSGVRDQTSFGLSTDFFVQSKHVEVLGVPNTGFPILTDYYDNKAGVELRQSLWRNGFGTFTRASLDMQRSMSRMELLKRRFELKNLLLKAENTYWSMVSLNQIVKLQEENVDRAKRLTEWMRKRVGMRLVDDVDGLQAQASFESRDLELQTSLDERSQMARQFNTLRGTTSDGVEVLADLPPTEMMLKSTHDASKRMTREDFKMVFEQASAAQAEARGATSQIAPQLDLVAGVATNGLDQIRSRSFDEINNANNPTWNVGVIFSVPLDYSLIGNMRRSYKAAERSADSFKQSAVFAEERAWHDLVLQKNEAQRRLGRAISLENVQTQLVKRERQRLMNGRTTTFQAITFEQNLALAQIQRVRSQLSLLQLHNVLKTWEGQP